MRAGSQGTGSSPCCLRSATEREYGTVRIRGKKKRKKLFNVLFRLCICYPFVCMDICEHFILLDLERQQTSSE